MLTLVITEYFIFFLTYVFWILALIGFGSALIDFLKKIISVHSFNDDSHIKVLLAGIFGMATVTTIATIINIFVPISLTISIIIITLGLIIFIINRKSIFTSLSKTETILLSALALLIFAIIPFAWVSWFDTGMYHLPTIRWIIESQVPLGLANLHGRLGFNCSWFMLSACIDQWAVLLNKPYFLINGILVFFYASAILLIIKRKFIAQKYEINNTGIIAINGNIKNIVRVSDVFFIFSLIALIYPGLMMLTSPAPDLPVILLTLFITYLIVFDLESNNCVNFYSFISVIISVYAVTIKLSAIPLTVTILILIFRSTIERYIRNKKAANIVDKKIFYFLLTGLTLLIVIPWILRGILLSGCMFFPFLVGYFPGLQWAVPIPLAENEVSWTTAWARLPGNDTLSSLTGWDWVEPWFERYLNVWGWSHIPLSRDIASLSGLNNFINAFAQNLVISIVYPISELYVPIIIFISSSILFLYITSVRKVQLKKIPIDWLAWTIPFIISLIGLAFWFYSAPDLRFGFGPIFSMVLLIFSIPTFMYLFSKSRGMVTLTGSMIKNRMNKIAISLVILLLIYGGYIIYYYSTNTEQWGSDGFNFPPIQLSDHKTVDGTTIYTSSGTYQLFWDGPLPNSPYFNSTLRTRVSNSTNLPDMFWYEDKNSLPIPL